MAEYVVMWQWGIRFAVHPTAYLVRVPHPPPKTREATQQGGQTARVSALRVPTYNAVNHGGGVDR